MISKRIREQYSDQFIITLKPRDLAQIMMYDDPEFKKWYDEEGKSLMASIYEYECQIEKMDKYLAIMERQYDQHVDEAIKRLEPKAVQDLQEFLQEYIRKGIKEDFDNDQEISEETGDR